MSNAAGMATSSVSHIDQTTILSPMKLDQLSGRSRVDRSYPKQTYLNGLKRFVFHNLGRRVRRVVSGTYVLDNGSRSLTNGSQAGF
jgi:hypothetical protein